MSNQSNNLKFDQHFKVSNHFPALHKSNGSKEPLPSQID